MKTSILKISFCCIYVLMLSSCFKKKEKQVKEMPTQQRVEKAESTKEKEKEYPFNVVKIDSVQFFKTFVENDFDSVPKITDPMEIIKLTKGKVIIKNGNEENSTDPDYYYADEIILKSGKKIKLNNHNECGLVAYFPTENIILSECSHTSDQAYNIITGDSTEAAGNPDFLDYSPTKKFRLNGWFPGQECISFFYQVKTKTGYKKIFKIETFDKRISEGFCNFEKFYWRDDHNFMFKIKNYMNNSERGVDEFYRLEIIEK